MGEWRHNSVASPKGKESSLPIRYDTVWAPESVQTLWSREKFLSHAPKLTLTIQPVAGRSIDGTISDPKL
jgi:hypothetical protein